MSEPRPLRLVCTGDSFTEGMSDDPRPDGQYTGWADRVAMALAQRESRTGGTLEYANLAVRGKLLDQVVAEQIPVAVSMNPTLLTFHAGPNDVLRRGTDFDDLARRYRDAVATLAAHDALVVLFTAIGRAGGSGRLAETLADRFRRFNDVVRETAAEYGALVVDLEPVGALSDRRLWNEDRLHLNAAGHRRVAAAVLETVGEHDPAIIGGGPGWWREPLPPASRTGRRADLAADVRWIRRHLVPWVGRRLRGVSSGDGRRAKDPLPRTVRPRALN